MGVAFCQFRNHYHIGAHFLETWLIPSEQCIQKYLQYVTSRLEILHTLSFARRAVPNGNQLGGGC